MGLIWGRIDNAGIVVIILHFTRKEFNIETRPIINGQVQGEKDAIYYLSNTVLFVVMPIAAMSFGVNIIRSPKK